MTINACTKTQPKSRCRRPRGREAEGRAGLIERLAEAHAQGLERAFRALISEDSDIKRLNRRTIEVWLTRHPITGAALLQAALHEGAHFLSFEWAGFVAWKANVKASRGGRRGWGGGASSVWGAQYGLSQDWGLPEVRREAVTVLVGLIAEELLGGGDALSSVGEILEACVLACRAAELTGEEPKQFFRSFATAATSLVEKHAAEMGEVGELLARRACIHRRQRGIGKILARVGVEDMELPTPSPAGEALIDKIMAALDELIAINFELGASEEFAGAAR